MLTISKDRGGAWIERKLEARGRKVSPSYRFYRVYLQRLIIKRKPFTQSDKRTYTLQGTADEAGG